MQQKTRLKSGKKQMTDSELIQDQIEKDVSQCQCRNPFNAQRMSEGKYRVRFLQKLALFFLSTHLYPYIYLCSLLSNEIPILVSFLELVEHLNSFWSS